MPDCDRVALPAILAEAAAIPQLVGMCDQHRLCIQAGGNVGVWPVRLAEHFERVLTFEPDPANWEALMCNTTEVDNLVALKYALGAQEGRAAMDHIQPWNIGAHQLQAGNTLDVVPLDLFNYEDVDLIQLDIEGSEYAALVGARETIERHHPLLCIEIKGLGARYGRSDADLLRLLDGWGYRQVATFKRDKVFRWGSE